MNDSKTSAAINRIRASAGNPMTQCPSCCRAAASPHRRLVAGAIVEGCIDAFHAGHLPKASNTAAWHNRKAAQQLRRDTLASLRTRP